MNMIKNISVVGLGKLGASMVAGFASRGFNVVGVDISQRAVDAINKGLAPVQETDLGKIIGENKDRISATTSTQEAVDRSDITFVIVPTPSDSYGSFSLEYVKVVFRALGQALKKKPSYHLIVLTSTVLPGSTRYGLLPILEQESEKRCGVDFGLCYNPEFIALGSVIRDFLNPDFYLLGQFDFKSGDLLEAVHNQVSQNMAPVKRMSLENAELAKVSINSYVTMKISFANMMAQFCEQIPGGDVDVVSDALGMDSRIGRKYLTGGLGFSGPCFPRDNVALNYLGNKLNVESGLLKINDECNQKLMARNLAVLRGVIPKGSSISVLGLAYKPLSHIIEQSAGMQLCQLLADDGFRVVGHDVLAAAEANAVLKGRAYITDNLTEALSGADVIFVTTIDDCYVNLKASQLMGRNEKPVVLVDFWRCLKSLQHAKNVHYIPMGICLDGPMAEKTLRTLWTQ